MSCDPSLMRPQYTLAVCGSERAPQTIPEPA